MPARATPYTDEEIRASVGAAHYVVELLGSRYADKLAATQGEILADAYNNVGLWVGPKIEGIFEKQLELLHVKISIPDGVIMDQDRKHPSRHPYLAYSWLVNFLNSRGQGLTEGHIVTPGSFAGFAAAQMGKPVRVELQGIGVIEIELSLT